MNPDKCQTCGTPLIPDKKSVTKGTNKWCGYVYKYNCDCVPKNVRVSIG